MLYFGLLWFQSLMFLNLQGQDIQFQGFFDEKCQEHGEGLHSSPSYVITGAYMSFSVGEYLFGPRACNPVSQVRTSLRQLVQVGVTPWCAGQPIVSDSYRLE